MPCEMVLTSYMMIIEKRQLERNADRAPNSQPDRSPRDTLGNRDKGTLTDRPLEQDDPFFTIPNTVTGGLTPTGTRFDNVALDLGAIDNLLGSFNSSNPLNIPLSSFLLASPRAAQTPPSQNRLTPRHIDLPEADSSFQEPAAGPTPPDEPVNHDHKTRDANKGWLSTVHIAAQKGHERIVQVLLERGNIDSNITDSDGRSPIFHAAVGGHHSVVRLLLSNGARVAHLDCDNRSVLHWAAHYQRIDVLQILVEHWAEHERDSYDIDAYDDHGWTPLHLAVERGFEEGVLLLIQFGADMNAKARKCWLTDKVIPFDLNQLVSQASK
ncbi:ankyrin repeat-containing domain protein [Aspergillus pseudoustus]|uniref:Ankyrin repeat-containing domain protein n=1 Tax=Aspergillus pseudoustus TaxID=1810923 RepID=A0ABR4KH50_9EURO